MKEENRMSAIVADNIDKVDDSVFKTPFLPSKKGNCKKNENRNNGHLEDIPQEENKINTKKEIRENERNDLLLDPFYNHKCPHTDSFIKKTWPDLSGSTVGDCEDLVMEVIIDDFSILLFRNNEEYNQFMKAENNRQAKLDAERKQKEIEAEARRRKEKKKALKRKLKLEKKMKKKKFEMENGMQPIPMSSEEKAERKRLKREMKEKKRADTGNKNKCRGSSLSPVLHSSDVPSTSNCTNLDSKHMQSPRTNDGYSLLAPNNNMKRPSSISVDSGIIGGPPTSKLPKLEVDEFKSSMLGIAVKTAEVVNVNKIPATPPSANTANGHSGTPTSSMDIKSSLPNNNSIQNNVSVSTPQTPSSSKQGLLTPGMQPTQCFSNNMMFMEILKTNPGLAAMLPNNTGLQVNIQNPSLSSNQSQQLLHLQQILHHQNTLANSVVQRGISNNNNPSNLIQQQMQMASSQIMPNMPIHNNLGTPLMNGFAGQINAPVVSTPTRPVPPHGSQVINKTLCNYSDTHLKICMEINNAKCTTSTANNGIQSSSNISNPTNTIQNNVSNMTTSTNESKKTTSILQASNSMPGITTGIVPSSSNILSTPGKAVNNVIPTNQNTSSNLTHQQAAMIQAMSAQLQQVNNAKLVVGNQRPQSVMANGGLFFNTPSGTNVPSNAVNHQALFSNNMSNSNEAAFQQLMMQAALQANGNIGQIQQQNPLLAAQITAMQQQHNQAANLLIQNAVNAQNSAASNLISVNTNQTPGALATNGDPNKSLLNSVNSKNVLIAQANEQKQKLLSICTNEILKCAQQIQHYQNLLNTLQIPAEKEAAKAEYMKYVAMHAELNNNLINIKSQLNTPLQQENLITAQQQLQAAAMAVNTNNRSQLSNNISIPNTMINNISVDSLYEIQRQAAAQQHLLRQYQNLAGIQQFQQQQQNQLNAAASVQNASMLQNQYAQSQMLQMQQLLAAQHPMFKQSNNSNSGNHNLEQLHRQRSATITGEISSSSHNGVCHQ
ncbi:Hypothetical protein SRAE_2000250400 [Strongyloides ratti]|uniref:Uncharacterized protein n=1 Tax=Strongyloides ratti TaxID=34506 RepID=A0A090LDK0_STRRB|nr:Hypothetical protein SRAE_2000250400 [Strongyloides ratti]CEF67842.1 Hypothetical protein SRAE_2000250400 [Strongyloides ratti]